MKLGTVGCHVFIQSSSERDEQSKVIGRGIIKPVKYASTINSNDSDSYRCTHSIGRGHRIRPITSVSALSHGMH